MADRNGTYTFTADGVSGDLWHHQSVCYLSIGHETAENFGGGTLLIQKGIGMNNVTWHTVRSITATEFAGLTNKTIAVELPPNTTVRIKLTGSSSPNLYVEYIAPNRVRVG